VVLAAAAICGVSLMIAPRRGWLARRRERVALEPPEA
jgi:hypothetical protein